MQIPLSYADSIIGTAGANISYMRRTSGATITIQETRGVHGEMTVEIHGTATQVQTAQQLIQVNFLVELLYSQQLLVYHVYTYICIYICVCVCACIHIYRYIFIYVNLYAHLGYYVRNGLLASMVQEFTVMYLYRFNNQSI